MLAPGPSPTPALSPPRQLAVVAIGLLLLAPLPWLASIPSIYSSSTDPALAMVSALAAAAVAFAVSALLTPAAAGLFLFAATFWTVLVGAMGPGCVLLLAALVAGSALSLSARASLREDHGLVITASTMLVAVVALYALSGVVRGFDALERLVQIPGYLIETTLRFLREALYPYGPLEMRDQRELNLLWEQAPLWIWLMPANALFAFTLMLFIATRSIRRWIRPLARRMPPFWAFAISEAYIYPVIALCLADAAAVVWEIAPLRLVADNALWFLFHLYWLAGLAVCHCLMLQRQATPLSRLVWWLILILFSGFLYGRGFLAALGLFDHWFHFRRVGARLVPPGASKS
ncbi:DUF2232 domain-containing protein [Candidatus Sumerlaeota bacterium]|nr:DUF2232 domain-containing protein [Candidatus Sumerlaeota bacterium]